MRSGKIRTGKQSTDVIGPVIENRPSHSLLVYPSQAFYVAEGVNRGDDLGTADDLIHDDIYALDPEARPVRLALEPGEGGRFRIAQDTEAGQPGAVVRLDCALEFMSPDGKSLEAIVLAENGTGDVYLLPLSPLSADRPLTLVNIDRARASQVLAQVACVSFTRGTRIALASGAQVPIEELKVGDKVLTRNEGPRAIRWIGQSTTRATGAFAPIVIKAGTLNNTGDLVVSPDHRLFVYQRSDRLGAGCSDLLVKARHLVNGETVYVRQGGFVDYFQLLFDRHQIIYAEGIAAESLLLDIRTKPALPQDLLAQLEQAMPDHGAGTVGFDVKRALLDRPDAVDLLRRASMN